MADPNRCPGCSAERPANAPGGLCSGCLMRQATSGDKVVPSGAEVVPCPQSTDPGHSSNRTEFDTLGTRASNSESIAGLANRTGTWSHAAPTVDGPSYPRGHSQGTTVRYFGDYEIHKELGRGGMGVVYKARQVSLNRPVALKMIKAGVLADDAELQRFQNEAEAVALLDHSGIVPIYEVGEHEGQRYFTMKLIEGGSLADRLGSFKDDPGAAVTLMIEMAEAVQHAHMRGILHRDLKPANILIDTQGHPHITDFGLAKRIESNRELTQSGAILGTPAYMSPEQALGRRGSITTATDVYGLGAILYALLTGKAPFGGDSLMETLDSVRSRPPQSPRKLNDQVPHDLELICLKCLEKNPLDRYPTAGALADDLRRFAAGEPVSVRKAGAFERAAKWARRKPTLAAAYLLGLLTLLFGGLGGAAVWQWQAAERARQVATKARATAENAWDSEARARTYAVKALAGEAAARATAEQLREKVERVEYGRTMVVAHQEWRENNITATLALLEGTRRDLRGWEWNYVHRLCHSDLLTFKGHTGFVTSASFSPDGSRVVTASFDKTAKVWDFRTGAEVLTLKGHTDEVYSASFSPDGSRVVTASADKTAKVWDAQTGADVLTLNGHNNFVTSASFSPDGSRVVTASHDRKAKVWDAQSGAELLTLTRDPGGVSSALFSPDGSRVVIASSDNTAKVLDAQSGAEVLTLKGHRGILYSASFSSDGSRVVTASFDKTAKVWDARTGAELLTLKGHTGLVPSASFSPDGSRVVTASSDKTAKVWDARTGAELLTLKGHTGGVSSASFSPDGSRVVTASSDNTAKFWDARTCSETLTLKGQNEYVTSASFSPDGSRVVIASSVNTAKVWDARTGAEVLTLKGHKGILYSASFSPDGSRVVTASFDRTAKVWDARTGAEVLTLKGHTAAVASASFSPDGSRVVTASSDNTAKLWDAQIGAEVLTLKGHTSPVWWASFSPDGSRVVTASADSTAKLWDAQTGAEILTLKGHSGLVYSASFSPDGSRVVTASADSTAKLWDAQTGAEVLTLKGHTGLVKSASFSPDGSRVVTASRDGTAKVWDAQTGAEVLTLKGHTDEVYSASFSPDGSRVVTASWDGTAKVWDATPINREFLTREPYVKPPLQRKRRSDLDQPASFDE
jgi:WD40 repeat protein/tRNA A-37 threonylcarbamoyl transferase component Bud32